LIGSFALSLLHAAIPNHWLPLVSIGKAEKWERKETLSVTAITAVAHTLSTLIIGIVVGVLGYQLSTTYSFITKTAAPIILITLGMIYLFVDYRAKRNHHLHIDEKVLAKKNLKSKTAIVTSLAVAMFFSPCLEIEAYYFTASKLGWTGITIVSVIYFTITLLGMLLLVYFGLRGIEKFKFHFMEHHEKLLSGIVLILLGIITFFIEGF